MSIIRTKDNFEILVDEEDYPLLSRYSWHLDHKGYAKTSAFGTTVKIHRMILNPSKNDQVDHANHNKLDNRKENLRVCSNALNQANTNEREYVNGKRTTSKYKGVCKLKSSKRWRAALNHKGKRYYLGWYDTEEEAALAYNKKAKEIWGEYALLNKVEGAGN